jgi:molybdopterin converting factor small subunit
MNSVENMSITVRLYSILRNRNGQLVNSLELQIPQGSLVSDVLTMLEVPVDLDIVLAINDQLSSRASSLREHDRLAIIPAVAGGVV